MRHRKPRWYRGNHRSAGDPKTRYSVVVSSALLGAGALAFGAGSAIPEPEAESAHSLNSTELTGNNSDATDTAADQGRSADLHVPGAIRRMAEPPPERLPDWMRPADGYISSVFGLRFGGSEFHKGLDIAGPTGSPIHAAAAGKVLIAGPHGGYGNLVVIDHGNGVTTYYGHNSRVLVDVGDEVQPGDRIALRGSTGQSTGPHCHFEVRINDEQTDPQAWLRKRGVTNV